MSRKLDEFDYKTIFNNPKYLALKHETVTCKKEPMVILTKIGISILKEKWGKVVNKNGNKSTNVINPKLTLYLERHDDAITYDNFILKLVLAFYTKPERYRMHGKKLFSFYCILRFFKSIFDEEKLLPP